MELLKKIGIGLAALVLAVAVPSGFGFWAMLVGPHTALGVVFFVATVVVAVFAGQFFFEVVLYLGGSSQSFFSEYTIVRKDPE